VRFYDLFFKTILRNEISFSEFKGKVCLVVNIASECRFTPQFHGLQTLYLRYRDRGFEILAFPSNDFGHQEPLDNKGIEDYCRNSFSISFPVFEKSHVIGKQANPVYKFLSSKKLNGKISSKPLWNFHKYLIDREGNVVTYFFSFTKPTSGRFLRVLERHLGVVRPPYKSEEKFSPFIF